MGEEIKEGQISELEQARCRMTLAEDRLAGAYERLRTSTNPLGKLLAARTVRVAGRAVYDSGEHLDMLEELSRYTQEQED